MCDDNFRFTLTSEDGRVIPIGLDVRTALRLWQDLGAALGRWARDHGIEPDAELLSRMEAATQSKTDENRRENH